MGTAEAMRKRQDNKVRMKASHLGYIARVVGKARVRVEGDLERIDIPRTRAYIGPSSRLVAGLFFGGAIPRAWTTRHFEGPTPFDPVSENFLHLGIQRKRDSRGLVAVGFLAASNVYAGVDKSRSPVVQGGTLGREGRLSKLSAANAKKPFARARERLVELV